MNINVRGLELVLVFFLASAPALAQKAPKPIDGSTIIDGTVTSAKIADGSLTGNDIADDAIDGGKVRDGSLTGADIDESTLVGVDAGTIDGVSLMELAVGQITSFRQVLVAPAPEASDPRAFAILSPAEWPFQIPLRCSRETISLNEDGSPVYGIEAAYWVNDAVDAVWFGQTAWRTGEQKKVQFQGIADVAFWPFGTALPASGQTEKRARIDIVGNVDEASSTCIFTGLVTIAKTKIATTL